jgi:SWI/SNF-related matrix-associated actin-dependent regulator 1 of chromatin subfamily A
VAETRGQLASLQQQVLQLQSNPEAAPSARTQAAVAAAAAAAAEAAEALRGCLAAEGRALLDARVSEARREVGLQMASLRAELASRIDAAAAGAREAAAQGLEEAKEAVESRAAEARAAAEDGLKALRSELTAGQVGGGLLGCGEGV